MTTQRRSRDRRPWWGTGLCALTIAAGACSSGHAETDGTGAASTAAPGPAVVTTVGAPTTAPPTPAAPTTAAPTTAAPTTAGAAPDAGAVLHQALDSLTSTYHFVSTVTLDGAVALVADGDRVGDGSRLTLASTAGNLSYVITPDGSWVMPDGGDWQPLDTDPANADPIGALRAPAAVQATSNDGSTAHLAVMVAPSALGLAGDALVPLDVAISGNVLSSVSYATTVGGKPAKVTSTFGPAHDPTPVAPPA